LAFGAEVAGQGSVAGSIPPGSAGGILSRNTVLARAPLPGITGIRRAAASFIMHSSRAIRTGYESTEIALDRIAIAAAVRRTLRIRLVAVTDCRRVGGITVARIGCAHEATG
jgi:hypothetical protein